MNGQSTVAISRYEDVWWAFRHHEFFTSAANTLQLGEQPLIPLEVDPPLHTKYRRLLNPQFVPREIEKLEPEVRAVVRGLIDETEFGDGGVDLRRHPNRHVAFGGGHHLCLGAHLARLELRVALEELHARIPDYRIPDGAEIHFSPGIRQADPLPLEFEPA